MFECKKIRHLGRGCIVSIIIIAIAMFAVTATIAVIAIAAVMPFFVFIRYRLFTTIPFVLSVVHLSDMLQILF